MFGAQDAPSTAATPVSAAGTLSGGHISQGTTMVNDLARWA
jgi:hypothetical protein